MAGDPVTPLCLVRLEMRSGRLIRLWQDQLGPFPPYRLDNDALIVGYMLAAEFGFHAAKGWGEPACALDAYVEFRHAVNDGAVKSGDREKGFYSIGGALRYFLEDEIDVAHKHDMRERILQGPPFASRAARHPGLLRGRRARAGAAIAAHRSDHPALATRCSGPSINGRSRNRNAAAFRWTARC